MSENMISKIKIGNIEYELETTIDNVSGLQDALDTKQPIGNYATEDFVTNKIAEAELNEKEVDLSGYVKTEDIGDLASKDIVSKSDLASDVQTSLGKADTALQSYTETDPTVPAWAKAATKPTYTASEVGALPADTVIPTVPTNVSAFANDAGYLTEHQSLEGLATETYVNTQIAAIPTPDVSGRISTHNTATDAHNDIRLLVEGLTTRLNALADSDDTTLDQMSEIVAYIKSNKTLIDGITTNKVNVSDIINNLTTNVNNKPLSAAQGVALKALIDAIVVPTKVSELTNDKGYLTSVPSEYITETELNAKGYLTEHQSLAAYAKTADLGALAKKDSLTASDVGALPNTTVIPDALADLAADSTHRLVTDSEKAAWNEAKFHADSDHVTSINGMSGDVVINIPEASTPVKGVDYWTDADKAEIKSYVDEAILGGAW